MFNQRKAYDAYIQEKWGKLCEDHNGMPNIKSDRERKELMMLLENTADFYNTTSIMDATTITTANTEVSVTGGNMVPAVIPPILRRLYPELVIRELVSVQPIPTPEAKVFFYNTTVDGLDSSGSATQLRNDDKDNITQFRSYSTSTTEAADDIPSIQFNLDSAAVTAQKKKLKAVFSKELEQDLNTYVGLSAYSESVANIAKQIGIELEYAVISALLASASAGDTAWHYTVASGTAQTEKKAWDATIFEAMIDADTDVYEKRYVNTNWVVADTRTIARLRKLQSFVLDPSFDPKRGTIKRQVIGTLNGQWSVIQDPWFMSNQMLLGYKSADSEYHAGFVFAPYILAYMTKPFESPDTLKTTVGFMSRFALKMLMGDMYSTVTISA